MTAAPETLAPDVEVPRPPSAPARCSCTPTAAPCTARWTSSSSPATLTLIQGPQGAGRSSLLLTLAGRMVPDASSDLVVLGHRLPAHRAAVQREAALAGFAGHRRAGRLGHGRRPRAGAARVARRRGTGARRGADQALVDTVLAPVFGDRPVPDVADRRLAPRRGRRPPAAHRARDGPATPACSSSTTWTRCTTAPAAGSSGTGSRRSPPPASPSSRPAPPPTRPPAPPGPSCPSPPLTD